MGHGGWGLGFTFFYSQGGFFPHYLSNNCVLNFAKYREVGHSVEADINDEPTVNILMDFIA